MNDKPSSKRRQAYPLINDEVYPIVIHLDRHSTKMRNCSTVRQATVVQHVVDESNRLGMTGSPGFFTTALYVRYPSLLYTSSPASSVLYLAPGAILRERVGIACAAFYQA